MGALTITLVAFWGKQKLNTTKQCNYPLKKILSNGWNPLFLLKDIKLIVTAGLDTALLIFARWAIIVNEVWLPARSWCSHKLFQVPASIESVNQNMFPLLPVWYFMKYQNEMLYMHLLQHELQCTQVQGHILLSEKPMGMSGLFFEG